MGRKVYNKLVRDRIPDIIAFNGGAAVTRVLNDEEFAESLKEKLVEEAREFLASGSVEELADGFQVILAILEERGVSLDELEEMRRRKAVERGGFQERLFLTYVDE